MGEHEWVLMRNCSLTPKQLGIAYAVLFILSAFVAAIFVLHGAWIVLYFTMLEMVVVAVAFLSYARHATDHEHLALQGNCLLVEHVEAGTVRQFRLDRCWTRIASPRRPRDLIDLEAHGVHIEIGRYITEAKRRQVAQELRLALRETAV